MAFRAEPPLVIRLPHALPPSGVSGSMVSNDATMFATAARDVRRAIEN